MMRRKTLLALIIATVMVSATGTLVNAGNPEPGQEISVSVPENSLDENENRKESVEVSHQENGTEDPLKKTEPSQVPKATTAPEASTVTPEPTTAPEEPTIAPEEPTTAPEEPTIAPEEPTVTPEPTTAPEEPTIAPEEPTIAPEEPTVTPEPTTAPEEPTVTPEPTTAPEEPTVTPEPTTAPEEPTVTPEPTTAPEEPTVTPKPTTAPEEPTVTPKPTTAPEKPTPTPTAEVLPVPSAVPSATPATGSAYRLRSVTPSIFSNFKKVYSARLYSVSGSFVNVREKANDDSRVVGCLKKGTVFYILEEENGWAYIEAYDFEGNVWYVRGFVKSGTYVPMDENESNTNSGKSGKVFVPAEENAAFTYNKLTTCDNVAEKASGSTAVREALLKYAEQFVGNPYVWGGESLINGCDCSGFTMLIYREFGIDLPHYSGEQAMMGERIAIEDAQPGDLVFYAKDGSVYHAMIYYGNGKVIHASSSKTGIVISNLNYDKVCWACRFFETVEPSSTQAKDLSGIGKLASQGDSEAQDLLIACLGQAAHEAWKDNNVVRSELIAQTILETEWLTVLPDGAEYNPNNVLANNTDEIYSDIETCYEHYCPTTYTETPEEDGDIAEEIEFSETSETYETIETNEDEYIAPEPVVNVPESEVADFIENYGLSSYDEPVTSVKAVDGRSYSQEELELIWALTAQEDDGSYEGALAVISSVMNRADINYGGYGTSSLDQFTADGQYCYSPKVSDPSYWQNRLHGNVNDYVKEAVSDCLTKGIRNHDMLNFRSRQGESGERIKLGSNYYF